MDYQPRILEPMIEEVKEELVPLYMVPTQVFRFDGPSRETIKVSGATILAESNKLQEISLV